MDRNDVELVLTKALEHLKPRLKQRISLVEIFDLSFKVLQEIQIEQNLEEKIIEYSLSRTDIETILTHEYLEISYDDGSKVSFVLEEDDVKKMTLENGGVFIWYEGEN